MVYTHRATWEIERGPIPPGMEVCHTCDNPPCRNIDHLFLGTHADNMADMVAKGRQARQRGEAYGAAKLTETEVREIRTIQGVPQWVIGAMYGVSESLIGLIRNRKRWEHL